SRDWSSDVCSSDLGENLFLLSENSSLSSLLSSSSLPPLRFGRGHLRTRWLWRRSKRRRIFSQYSYQCLLYRLVHRRLVHRRLGSRRRCDLRKLQRQPRELG